MGLGRVEPRDRHGTRLDHAGVPPSQFRATTSAPDRAQPELQSDIHSHVTENGTASIRSPVHRPRASR